MDQPMNEFRDSALWAAIQGMLTELTASGEVSVNTAPAYVISYLCQELRAKNMVTEAALTPRSGTKP